MRFLALRLALAGSLLALPAAAQRWEYGLGLGGSLYKGDLTPTFNPLYTKLGGEAFVRYNPSYATAFRINAAYMSVKGDGADSPDPYISTLQPNRFSTPIFEVSGGLEYNFFNFRDPLRKRDRGTPFLYMGLGMFWFQPESPETNKITSIQPVIPFGVGYKYRLGKNLNFGAEFIARKTFTDYLDGVSDKDPVTGWQRGFKWTSDWYCYFGVTLSYTVYNILCPFDYNAPH